MHISQEGLALIEQFEGFSSRPYWDAYGRVWTRGYGETEGITSSSPAISRAGAQARLRTLIEQRYEWAIRELDVNQQHVWDALCSFAWNLGAGIFNAYPSLAQKIRDRQLEAAGQEMLQFDHAGGIVLAGLRRRRQLEVRLMLAPEPKPSFVPADEARWIAEWDKLANRRGLRARARRRALRAVMRARATYIDRLANAEVNGWQNRNRRARFDALYARAG